ncbi:hypothetical protein VZT92_017052 [Zoarces viviparus]|uniref:Uncharacterized protein n=1 Tax=Zoarces viviparus TaxID=48416 RepID=A0AAW1EQK8_ZOAVI
MLDRAQVVVTLTVTDVLGRTGLELPQSHLSTGLKPDGLVPEQGLYRLEIRERSQELFLREGKVDEEKREVD